MVAVGGRSLPLDESDDRVDRIELDRRGDTLEESVLPVRKSGTGFCLKPLDAPREELRGLELFLSTSEVGGDRLAEADASLPDDDRFSLDDVDRWSLISDLTELVEDRCLLALQVGGDRSLGLVKDDMGDCSLVALEVGDDRSFWAIEVGGDLSLEALEVNGDLALAPQDAGGDRCLLLLTRDDVKGELKLSSGDASALAIKWG
jgi:hypothetical protein